MQIKTLKDYLEHVSEKIDTCHHDTRVLLRGHYKHIDCPKPTIDRNDVRNRLGFANEVEIANMAHIQCPELFPMFSETTAIEVLSKLQHYGAPTRLLDFTTNMFVALYFACKCDGDAENKNGEIIGYVLNRHQENKYEDEDDGYCERGMPRFTQDMTLMSRLAYWLCTGQNDKVDKKILGKTIEGSYVNCRDLERPIFFEAPKYSIRQTIQDGWYALFPTKPTKDEVRFHETPFLVDLQEPDFRFEIPAKYKKVLLEKLEILSIDRIHLFPDDLDGVCKSVSEKVATAWRNLAC